MANTTNKAKSSGNKPKTESKLKAKKNEKIKSKAQKKALRKKKIRRALIIALAVVLLLCAGFGFGVYKLVDSLQPNTNEELEIKGLVSESSLFYNADVQNILLLGMDGRKSDGRGLSDVMMLVSINRYNRTVTMVSFQRDTWVEIPGYGEAKINASGSYGGPALVIATLESNFHIRIDGYVLVTFEAFRKAVDAFGGIRVPVTAAEAAEIKRYSKSKISVPAADNVLLTGEEALLYVRIRKQDDDWHRTERQRTALKALAENAKNNPLKTIKAAQDILPEFETNLSGSDIAKLLAFAPGAFKYEVKEQHVPADDTWKYQYINGQAAIVADISCNEALLRSWLYD
ncbi:MAG: LCP family protein [Clostridium sp.]|jgi:LCP family protein required for cell wall assembly|nr:LCP family protein [Clostridium sp.]